MKVLLDTSPLGNAHSHRGIGMYTRLLKQHLEEVKGVEVFNTNLDDNQAFDIVHYPYFDLFQSTLPSRHKATSVVTIHDIIPLLYPEYYPKGLRGRFGLYRQKQAVRNVSAVITDSENSRQDIIDVLEISPSKVHVVHLAANPAIAAASPSKITDVKKHFSLPKLYILYVGDINYNKNIPQLLKSLKYLPDEVELVCVGRNFFPHDIPEWQWIETQLALSDVKKRVTFLTSILSDDHQTLSALYTGALAYVQPSLYEGFGLPVLEAMQAKTPVVTTQTSSLVEVAGEHATFVSTDAESIANGVQVVMDMSVTQRRKHIAKAHHWSQTFSWEKTALDTHQVYMSLL